MSLRRARTLLSLLIMCVIAGCHGHRVVFVPESDGLIRLGPDVTGYVYYWNGTEWELSSTPVVLPEGWYAGSLPESEDSRPAAADNHEEATR